jgi:AcrR family transcriptional regulator
MTGTADMAAARPRRGAPPKGAASARERILATANELFYREGIHATGVDTVVERSGVSKTSLYRAFRSKDELIAAFATERDRSFWAWWDRIEERHAEDPRALLEALLRRIAKLIGVSGLSVPEPGDGAHRPGPSRPDRRAGQQGGDAPAARHRRGRARRVGSRACRVSVGAAHQRRDGHRPGGSTGRSG